jgi:hypothetical protein
MCIESIKQIPTDIKFDPHATPPQWTDNVDQIIEKGTPLRIKLTGIRSELGGDMFGIATIKEVSKRWRESFQTAQMLTSLTGLPWVGSADVTNCSAITITNYSDPCPSKFPPEYSAAHHLYYHRFNDMSAKQCTSDQFLGAQSAVWTAALLPLQPACSIKAEPATRL